MILADSVSAVRVSGFFRMLLIMNNQGLADQRQHNHTKPIVLCVLPPPLSNPVAGPLRGLTKISMSALIVGQFSATGNVLGGTAPASSTSVRPDRSVGMDQGRLCTACGNEFEMQ